MSDARRAERTKSLLRAQATFSNGAAIVECTVRNISTDGARLDVGETVAFPVEFDLSIPQRGRSHRARIIWRDPASIGVMFMAPPPETDTRNVAHLRDLEHQNTILKTRVRLLTERLQELGQNVNF
jgi:hypothetical protein